ncbi:MAG: ROK family protein, partial [Bryobacteraceae bacterium]|nr:ROK family protein [Bryobacteraceae bacterium]
MDVSVKKAASSRLYGAVDIGGTKIAVGIVSSFGEVVWSSEFPTEASLGPERALGQICAVMDDGIIGVGRRLEATGVGCTGPVDPVSGTIGDVALLPGWQGYPLCSQLEKHFKAPACLENDCDAAALGGFSYGAGRGSARFLYTTISTGIGVGIVVDGKVYRGTAGAHPELGHHTIDHSAGPD